MTVYITQCLSLSLFLTTVLAKPHTCLLTLSMNLDSTGKLSVVRPSRLSLSSELGHTQSGTILSIRRLMRGLHRAAHTDHQRCSRLLDHVAHLDSSRQCKPAIMTKWHAVASISIRRLLIESTWGAPGWDPSWTVRSHI